ncbi:hypothetical protein [Desulforamulus ruminis]|uniref:Uncharacterized protein n=1 Tax=Desulforamulus ruminis (strain ATCC 23193 / DSM 2154 / NCIMB 8452 / DL) TaxID=696281 RepID=F6DTB4_DESRL|nr:hypothetical protein [Desulforamulus ruminis]AEG58931.1 hypothetical protein Desru_0646 [Desulforamulus ruminis DSM 2154]
MREDLKDLWSEHGEQAHEEFWRESKRLSQGEEPRPTWLSVLYSLYHENYNTAQIIMKRCQNDFLAQKLWKDCMVSIENQEQETSKIDMDKLFSNIDFRYKLTVYLGNITKPETVEAVDSYFFEKPKEIEIQKAVKDIMRYTRLPVISKELKEIT